MKKTEHYIDVIKGVLQGDPKYTKSKLLKILIFTIKGMGKHDIVTISAALTFYTLMSLVPIVAVIFAVLKGFGFEENLTEYLYANFSDYTNVIDVFLSFVNRMLAKTRGGIIAAVGVAVLLWSVIKVFGNIEDAFNKIWEVRKARSLSRKFGDYLSIIFIAPILLVSSLSLGTVITNFLSFLNAPGFVNILLWIISFALIWILFAFIYWLMPNTKVNFKGAIIAGMIAGTAFLIFSFIYFYIQGEVSSYNAIYGTFAALPLFLAWMQTSWQILLIGGELSFVYQHYEYYEQEQFAETLDVDHKRKALLATMLAVIKNFIKDESAINASAISVQLNLPVGVVRDMIYKLGKAGLIAELAKDDDYIPAKDVHTITVSEVLEKTEKDKPAPDFSTYPEIKAVNKILDQMWNKAFDPELNKLLIDIIED